MPHAEVFNVTGNIDGENGVCNWYAVRKLYNVSGVNI